MPVSTQAPELYQEALSLLKQGLPEYQVILMLWNNHPQGVKPEDVNAAVNRAAEDLRRENERPSSPAISGSSAVSPSTVQPRFVPQPDAGGEFSTPAEGAKFMASFGIPQTPLRGKAPFLAGWEGKASSDFVQIDSWYAEYKCNFGSVAKATPDGFFALEVDSQDVRTRFKADTSKDFTAKLIVQSHKGGHRWYRHSSESIRLGNLSQSAVINKDFSLRADNQQCVSPGSVHPDSGRQYRVVSGYSGPEIATHDELNWLTSQRENVVSKAPLDEGAPILAGARNATLTSVAGGLRQKGLNKDELESVLLRINDERCQPPLEDSEVKAIARSVARYSVKDTTVLLHGVPAGARKTNVESEMGAPEGAKPTERLEYVLVFEDADDLELVRLLGFSACSVSESAEKLKQHYKRVVLMGSTKSKALSELQARIRGSLFIGFPPDYNADSFLGYGGKKRYPPVKRLSAARYPDRNELLSKEDVRSYLNRLVSGDAVRASVVQEDSSVATIDNEGASTGASTPPDLMPASAMASSRLGDIYAEKFEPHGWPLDLALPALVTAASVIVPPLPKPQPDGSSHLVIVGDDAMVNLYTALIGPVHVGKSQVTEWAAKAIGIYSEGKGPHYYEVKAGSAEQLIKSLNKYQSTFKNSLLITPDEWAHLFAKAAIPDASFPTFLTTSFYRRRQTITMAKGKEIDLNLAMSFIGGIVENDFDTVFNASSLGGLYDRFLFGRSPDGYRFNYRPFPSVASSDHLDWKPVHVRQDGSLFEVIKAWNEKDASLGRIVELCSRIAAIFASMDGREIVFGKDLEALWGLAQYQMRLRAQFRPNAGINPDAIFANAAMNWIEKYAANWVSISKLKNAVHAYEMKLGPNVAERALLSLSRGGRIDLWLRGGPREGKLLPPDYKGPAPKIGLVRRVVQG